MGSLAAGAQCRSPLVLSWRRTRNTGQAEGHHLAGGGTGPHRNREAGGHRANRQGERQGRWELQNKLTDKFWDRFCPLLLGRRLDNGYPRLMGSMLSLCL